MSKHRTVIVTCSLDSGSVERVEKRLSEAGFEVHKILEFAGSITGIWNRDLEELRAIDEVDAAEDSQMLYSIDLSEPSTYVEATDKAPSHDEHGNTSFEEEKIKNQQSGDDSDGNEPQAP